VCCVSGPRRPAMPSTHPARRAGRQLEPRAQNGSDARILRDHSGWLGATDAQNWREVSVTMTLRFCNRLCNSADRICRVLHALTAGFRIRLCLHSRQVPQPYVCGTRTYAPSYRQIYVFRQTYVAVRFPSSPERVTRGDEVPFLVTVTAIVGLGPDQRRKTKDQRPKTKDQRPSARQSHRDEESARGPLPGLRAVEAFVE
jgi:hypothetical protein